MCRPCCWQQWFVIVVVLPFICAAFQGERRVWNKATLDGAILWQCGVKGSISFSSIISRCSWRGSGSGRNAQCLPGGREGGVEVRPSEETLFNYGLLNPSCLGFLGSMRNFSWAYSLSCVCSYYFCYLLISVLIQRATTCTLFLLRVEFIPLTQHSSRVLKATSKYIQGFLNITLLARALQIILWDYELPRKHRHINYSSEVGQNRPPCQEHGRDLFNIWFWKLKF